MADLLKGIGDLVDGAAQGVASAATIVVEGGEVKEEGAGVQLTTGKTVEVAISFAQLSEELQQVGRPLPPDGYAWPKECANCGENFKWFSRHRFCRMCGKTFCSACAIYEERMRLPDDSVTAEPTSPGASPGPGGSGEESKAITGKLGLDEGRVCNSCEVEFKTRYRTPQLQVCGADAKGKETQPFAPLIAGFLQRRNWTGLRDWVTRYVVFDSVHHQILYYQIADTKIVGSKTPSGKVALPLGTELLGGYQNQFAISFPNGYEITFQCKDPEDTKHWRTEILRYLQTRPLPSRRERKEREAQRPNEHIADEIAAIILRHCKGDARKAAEVVELLRSHKTIVEGRS
jgi:hypothetical protein